jgi:hypothetical protein
MRHLGNHRQAALELRVHDAVHHIVDEFLRKTRRHQIGARMPAIDHEIEESVYFAITETQLAFVGLSRPLIGRRLLADNRLRNADGLSKRPNLRLIEIA